MTEYVPLPPYPGTSATSSTSSTRTVGPNAPPPRRSSRYDKRSTLKDSEEPAKDRQATVAAMGSTARLIYGTDLIGPQIAAVAVSNDRLYLLGVWGAGEVGSIVTIYESDNDTAGAEGFSRTDYLGTTTQTADPTFSGLISGYSDTLRGTVAGYSIRLAYSVFSFHKDHFTSFPRLTAKVQGRKLYDPREGLHDIEDPATWEYSNNPVLVLADFIHNWTGYTLDWSTVDAAANACDEAMAGDTVRRQIGLTIERRQNADAWMETLRQYAGVYLVRGSSGIQMIPDRPRSVDHSIVEADILADSLRLAKRSRRNLPTVVKTIYTDISAEKWRDAEATVSLPAVDAGTLPWRETVLRLPGIQTYAQARREATEELNRHSLADLEASWSQMDEALEIEEGDVVAVTHRRGLAAKQMRISEVVNTEPGRWRVSAVEYDPAIYSDEVATDPTYDDTNLPSVDDVPVPTNLLVTEEVFQFDTGIYASRFRITWTPGTYFYSFTYSVVITDEAGDIAWSGTPVDAEFVTGAIKEGVNYGIKVCMIGVNGNAGPALSDVKTALGKQLVPGNVPEIRALEVGGEVRADWDEAPDLDIWRYELRYWPTSGSWGSGTILDRVDALRYLTKSIPQGSWVLGIKSIDSIRQYSTGAATANVTVTQDPLSFAEGEERAYSTSSNMVNYTLGPGDDVVRYVTDAGSLCTSIFTSTPLATYANTMAGYNGATSCELLTDTWQPGGVIAGNWIGQTNAGAVTGTLTKVLELSNGGATWATSAALSVNGTYDRSRFRFKGTATGDTIVVTMPQAKTSIVASPRRESGTDQSSATSAATITLDNSYFAYKQITVTPLATAARSAVVDNITLASSSSFDVYIFTASGGQSTTSFSWVFEGL